MEKDYLKPDFVFESSWEVCNKVGGIYTVLSSRAKTLQEEMKDHIIFIGPDLISGRKMRALILKRRNRFLPSGSGQQRSRV